VLEDPSVLERFMRSDTSLAKKLDFYRRTMGGPWLASELFGVGRLPKAAQPQNKNGNPCLTLSMLQISQPKNRRATRGLFRRHASAYIALFCTSLYSSKSMSRVNKEGNYSSRSQENENVITNPTRSASL